MARTTRQRIVAATNELFRRKGFNGTSLSDVVAASEATTGSLYHFFPGGKAELAAAVLAESGEAYRRLFEEIASAADGPVQAVSDFFDGAADVLEQTDYVDLCPIGTVAREVASTHESLRRAAGHVFDDWIATVVEMLDDEGLTGPEATALAATLVAAVEGGFVLARTQRDAGVLRDVGREMRSLVEVRIAQRRPRARSGRRR